MKHKIIAELSKEIQKQIELELAEAIGNIKPPAANPAQQQSNLNKIAALAEPNKDTSHEPYEPEMSPAMKKTQKAKADAEIKDKNISGLPSEKIF